ncbi:MAG: MBL fold metallo-hydrolase [Thermoplasmata archaeon]
MSELTFYGGVGEIGGNKILLNTGEEKIFLDFGKNFGKEKAYYDDPYLSPREDSHLLNLGLLPRIENIYKGGKEPDIDGVLITHPHLDHWGYTCFLDDSIPLYCGEGTKRIIVNYEQSSSVGPNTDYYLAHLTKTIDEVYKDFRTFRTGDKFDIDDINIEPVHVDHSVPAAYGYIIRTDSETIAYTGDFRLHGPKSDMSEEFIEKASRADPDLLISEGTNITGGHISSEAEVEKKMDSLIGETQGLVVISFSQRNIDRLRSVYKVAKNNDRKLAISMKQAFLLKELRDDPHLDIFDITRDDVIVFGREKSSRSEWEKRVLDEVDFWKGEDIKPIQNEVVLVATYYDMNDLMDVEPVSGSVFISSQSEAFDEEGEIQHEKLLNWCEHYGLPHYQIHTSGHVLPHQLKDAIEKIDPDEVMPVHTDRPKLFKRYMEDLEADIVLPKMNESLKL